MGFSIQSKSKEKLILPAVMGMFLLLALSSLAQAQQAYSGITSATPAIYGDYRIYATQGSDNSWVKLDIRKLDSINGTLNITQASVNKDSSKDFSSLGFSIKVAAIRATQDNVVSGADIVITSLAVTSPLPSSGGSATITDIQAALFGNYKIYATQGSTDNWAKISIKDSSGTEVGSATINKGYSKDFDSLGITVWLDAVRADQDNKIIGADIRVAQKGAPAPIQSPVVSPVTSPVTSPSGGEYTTINDVEYAVFRNGTIYAVYTIYAIQGSDDSWAKISIRNATTGTEVGQATINKGSSFDFDSLGITVWLDSVSATQDNKISRAGIRVAQKGAPVPIQSPVTSPAASAPPESCPTPTVCPTQAKEIDKGFLLDAAVRLELLKTRFDSLGRLSLEIADYWGSVGKAADADKWKKVKGGMDRLIDKVGTVNTFVKSIKNNPTTEDFTKLKADIKQLSADLGGLLDSIYA